MINAGVWYFGYYHYLDYPLFISENEELVESINKVDDIEVLRSTTLQLIINEEKTDRSFTNLLDTTVNGVVTVSLVAALFFIVSIIHNLKLNNRKDE